MLSNVTEGNRALLQTILLGQPQLRALLASPDLDQLRQRVLASYHLAGLSREETHAYVEHRMRAVGWDGRPSWEDSALDLVHQYSGGIPRRINRLCSRVLLGGALDRSLHLTAPMVEATALELEEDLGSGAPDIADAALHDGPSPSTEAALDDLMQRVEALERLTARRERVFRRMMDLFAETGSPRR